MEKAKILYDAYLENPFPGVEVELLDGDKKGVRFKQGSTASVNVYEDGTIFVATREGNSRSLNPLEKLEDPTLFRVVNAAMNDFEMMELQENCSDSIVYMRPIQVSDVMDAIERRRKAVPGMTQKKLCDEIGIGLSTYKDYLTGRSDNITLKTAKKIADVLKCELSDFFSQR